MNLETRCLVYVRLPFIGEISQKPVNSLLLLIPTLVFFIVFFRRVKTAIPSRMRVAAKQCAFLNARKQCRMRMKCLHPVSLLLRLFHPLPQPPPPLTPAIRQPNPWITSLTLPPIPQQQQRHQHHLLCHFHKRTPLPDPLSSSGMSRQVPMA